MSRSLQSQLGVVPITPTVEQMQKRIDAYALKPGESSLQNMIDFLRSVESYELKSKQLDGISFTDISRTVTVLERLKPHFTQHDTKYNDGHPSSNL